MTTYAVAGAPAAGGLDHDVKAASVRDLHCFFLAVLIDRVDGVYGAQLLCHFALHGDRLNDGDVCAAGVQRQLRHDHAHRAAAGNGDRLAGLDADEVDAVQADGDRLDQRALFETAGVGQLVYGLLTHDDIVREGGACAGHVLAELLLPVAAVVAASAVLIVIVDNAVADFKPLAGRCRAKFGNDAGRLMSDGGTLVSFKQEVQFCTLEMQIRAADAAVGHPDFDLICALDLRFRCFDHFQRTVSKITNAAHSCVSSLSSIKCVWNLAVSMIPDCPGLCALYFNLFPPKNTKAHQNMPAVFVHIHNFAYAIVKNAWWKCENYTLMV